MNRGVIDFFDQIENLGGIFDAAKDQRVAVLAKEHPKNSLCLYNGDSAKQMQFLAPYLFDFRRNKTLRDLMASLSWGESWGIWYETSSSIEDCKANFRRHHLVELPDGRKVYFRFFDPRIFPTFIENSELREQVEFSRGIRRFLVEAEDENDCIHSYCLDRNKIAKSRAEI